MQNTWSIGRTWKPREGWSRPVLTDERQHSFPDLFGERIILLQTIPYGNEHGNGARRINASRPLSGSQAATRPADLGVWPYKRRFAAVMAQVRRPVPFRTRKLRPGTAMVLHSTGCGRVARRRIICYEGVSRGFPPGMGGDPGKPLLFFSYTRFRTPGGVQGRGVQGSSPTRGESSRTAWPGTGTGGS